MEYYTIEPIKWIIKDKNGMSRGYINSPFKGEYYVFPSYGKAQSFDTLAEAAKYVAEYHNVRK